MVIIKYAFHFTDDAEAVASATTTMAATATEMSTTQPSQVETATDTGK